MAAANMLANSVARGKSASEFHDSIRDFLTACMNDPVNADQISNLAALSDPEAVAQYIIEMLPCDLRPELGEFKAPVLALIATNSYKKGMADAKMRAFYERILANAPRAAIVLIHEARHVLVVDQPDAVGLGDRGLPHRPGNTRLIASQHDADRAVGDVRTKES